MFPRSIIWVLLLLTTSVFAAARQDTGAILDTVKNFLRHEISGLPGTVELQINAADMRISLADCAQLQAFIPDGASLTGDTSVGVRCLDGTPWIIVLHVHIQVTGYYLVAARPIAPGQTLRKDDLVIMEGDLARLPADVLNAPAQAIGKVTATSIASGAALHPDMMRGPVLALSGRKPATTAHAKRFITDGEPRILPSIDDWQEPSAKAVFGKVPTGNIMDTSLVKVAY